MQVQFTPKDIARFWSKVDKNGPVPAHRPELGPCWIHSGTPSQKYPKTSAHGQIYVASRFAYLAFVGDIADTLCVCHHCDNTKCVNPAHFFLGTKAENNADMIAKGRYAKTKRPPTILLHRKSYKPTPYVLAVRAQCAHLRELYGEDWEAYRDWHPLSDYCQEYCQ